MCVKKLRIAHIAGGLTFGGVESVILNYFSHMDLSDYELTFIAYDTPDNIMRDRFEQLGFTVFQVTKKRDNIVKSCAEVYEILKRREINIVHSHMSMMSFVTSTLGLAVGAKVRIAHSHIARRDNGLNKLLNRFLRPLNIFLSTDYFACGTAAAEYLFGSKLLKNGKVVIIQNHIEQTAFSFNSLNRQEFRYALGIGERFCVGHSGRFAEQKNHAFLLKIFAEIKRQRPDCVLLLSGNGSLEGKIKALAKELRLYDDIIFTGGVSNMPALYSAMDIFILPSLYEGFPLVVVEASAAGLPVLASQTIDKDICDFENVMQLPLEVGASLWAEHALNLSRSRVRCTKPPASNTDILAIEAKKLDSYYRKAAGLPPRR